MSQLIYQFIIGRLEVEQFFISCPGILRHFLQLLGIIYKVCNLIVEIFACFEEKPAFLPIQKHLDIAGCVGGDGEACLQVRHNLVRCVEGVIRQVLVGNEGKRTLADKLVRLLLIQQPKSTLAAPSNSAAMSSR